jgi:hypothetical protein
MLVESASGTQKTGTAVVSVHDKPRWHGPLGCYTGPKDPQGQQVPVLTGQSIDLTLPVLQQNQLAQSAPADTPLYVERRTSGNAGIADVVEVVQAPGSTCPQPAQPSGRPLPVPDASSASTAPSASPSASASPSPSGTVCYTAKAGTSHAAYFFPSSVVTTETLTHVNLSYDHIDAMVPSGVVTSNNVIWQQGSGLSPTLSATSLSSAANASKETFFAGVLYGLAAGFFVPFVQGFPDAWRTAKAGTRRRRSRVKRRGASPPGRLPATMGPS